VVGVRHDPVGAAERSLAGSVTVRRAGVVPVCIPEKSRGIRYKPSAMAGVASLFIV